LHLSHPHVKCQTHFLLLCCWDGSAQPESKARCGWGRFAATCLQPCSSIWAQSCSGTYGPTALWSPSPSPAPTLVCATAVTLHLLFMARPNEGGLISQGNTLFPVLTVRFRRPSLTWCSQVHILSAYFLELYFGLFPLCFSCKGCRNRIFLLKRISSCVCLGIYSVICRS